MKRVITDDVVAREHAAGRRTIAAHPSTAVITPAAWSKARELGVTFEGTGEARERKRAASDAHAKPKRVEDKGSAERAVDKSGVVVVKGRSVRLGEFAGAGPGKHVGLVDLVTAADGAPMTAGIMSFAREDAFPWTLTYDEIDLVLEGVLHVVVDGRTVEGRAGDVLYIPKGSAITFATPSRTKVFYVTYPADWAAAPPAPRPQR